MKLLQIAGKAGCFEWLVIEKMTHADCCFNDFFVCLWNVLIDPKDTSYLDKYIFVFA